MCNSVPAFERAGYQIPRSYDEPVTLISPSTGTTTTCRSDTDGARPATGRHGPCLEANSRSNLRVS